MVMTGKKHAGMSYGELQMFDFLGSHSKKFKRRPQSFGCLTKLTRPGPLLASLKQMADRLNITGDSSTEPKAISPIQTGKETGDPSK